VRRFTRFAILQAMGMQRLQVISVVSVEYLVTVAYSLLSGLGLGMIGSRLFVPFFSLTGSRQVPVPPFIATIDWGQARSFAAMMGLTLVLAQAIVLWQMLRARLFEALRIG
jgi:hypothetical protein